MSMSAKTIRQRIALVRQASITAFTRVAVAAR